MACTALQWLFTALSKAAHAAQSPALQAWAWSSTQLNSWMKDWTQQGVQLQSRCVWKVFFNWRFYHSPLVHVAVCTWIPLQQAGVLPTGSCCSTDTLLHLLHLCFLFVLCSAFHRLEHTHVRWCLYLFIDNSGGKHCIFYNIFHMYSSFSIKFELRYNIFAFCLNYSNS